MLCKQEYNFQFSCFPIRFTIHSGGQNCYKLAGKGTFKAENVTKAKQIIEEEKNVMFFKNNIYHSALYTLGQYKVIKTEKKFLLEKGYILVVVHEKYNYKFKNINFIICSVVFPLSELLTPICFDIF